MSLYRGSIDDDSLGAAWQELAEQAAQQAAQGKPWLLKLLVERSAALAARYALWKQRLQQLRLGERRRLQRRLGVGLAGAALLLALAAAPGQGAPSVAGMTVTDGTGTIANNSDCSLPEAIINANNNDQSGSTDCATGAAGLDTITLNTDVTLTTYDNSTYGPTGLPVVTSEITIEGNGHTISRDGSASVDFGILAVGSGGNLTLNSATVSGGVASPKGGGIYARSATLAVSNSTLSGNSASSDGGGLYARLATVTVSNSTLSGNSANGVGGIYAYSATLAVSNSTLSGNSSGTDGGGIHAYYGTVTVSNSTLSGNSASSGGGIWASSATLAVSNSTLSGNSATFGGGIHAYYGTVTVSNSTLSGNSASSDGGGLYAGYSTVMVSNSTLSGNSASSGGGIWASSATLAVSNSTLSGNSATFGGAIYAYYGTVTVSNSTLSGNSVSQTGGGIYARYGTLAVSNSTLSGNSAGSGGGIFASYGTLAVSRSLVSGNSAAYAGNEVFNYSSTIAAANFNLFGHSGETNAQAFTNFTPGATDITATSDGSTSTALASILTTPLADNDSTVLAGAPPGAIVKTLALPVGSPAIDAAPSADCLAAPTNGLDQRGKARNADGNAGASANECDIGAFEAPAGAPPANIPRIVIQKQTRPDGDTTPFQFKLSGPVNRSFTLTDNGIKSTGLIPAGVYTLEEILPPGWTPAIPLDQLTCDDGSPISAINLAADEVVVCRFLNYKGGNLIVKKVTIPPVASPSFSMRLINNTTNAKQTFSLAHNQQFDSGALDTAATYKLLEAITGGWKKKSIVCDNGSPSTSITPAAGGTVTCTVTNENSAPGGIQLSSNSVKENQPVGTVIGTLSAGDSVAGDTHTFTFVDDGSAGASGNSKFQIAGKQLKSAAVFDYETKTSYNIKLKVTDSAGQTAVKNFVVQNLNAPN